MKKGGTSVTVIVTMAGTTTSIVGVYSVGV